VAWLGIALSKFSRWSQRLGTPNEHNAIIPRDFWLEDWEKVAIIEFHDRYPLEGYRRLTYMMLDADVVAVSPSSVYRVLKAAGKLAPPVYRQGLQRVHPNMWCDSCENITILSPKQRQDGAVVRNCERRVHSRPDASGRGRRPALGRQLRNPLQHGAFAQCDRLRYSGRQTGWSCGGNLDDAETEAGGGQR
jgi:hypothetical protein